MRLCELRHAHSQPQGAGSDVGAISLLLETPNASQPDSPAELRIKPAGALNAVGKRNGRFCNRHLSATEVRLAPPAGQWRRQWPQRNRASYAYNPAGSRGAGRGGRERAACDLSSPCVWKGPGGVMSRAHH